MQISKKINGSNASLILSGRFDFHTHHDFCASYQSLLETPGLRALDIELGLIEFLDSSALGMLLVLKELAANKGITLALAGSKGTVRSILDIAKFNLLFTIR